jgi:4-amino-4-deoxy-L-arabinose transferase-like glycosyltransferase
VLSVKLLGWGQFSLKLPEALAGTLAVPLLYDTVRRAVNRPAGLVAAVALAVLPESVLTARSDTMDTVMMLCVIAALWLVVHATGAGGRPRRDIVLAGVALGLAFNVKLLEAMIAAPAMVVFLLLAVPPGRVRVAVLRNIGMGALAAVGVGLSWAVLASIAPGRHPWPIGSTDGSIWNAMFVFNGFGKVGSTAPIAKPGGPGPLRLLVSTGWHYDELVGCMLVAAVAIGGAAAGLTYWRARARERPRAREREPGATERVPRAFAVCLAVWIGCSLLAFDTMHTVHARYLEAMAPALAATIGYGAAVLAGLAGREARPSFAAVTAALACVCAYTFSFKPASLAAAAGALILSAVGAALIARSPGPVARPAQWLLASMIAASALVFPVHETLSLVRSGANDSLGLAATAPENATALSAYLRDRARGARYELAVDEPLSLAPLVIRDQRPILPLTSFGGRPLTSVEAVLAAVRTGAVRYGLVSRVNCAPARSARSAACTPAALWIRAHGVDVTSAVGLVGAARLYRLRPDGAG